MDDRAGPRDESSDNPFERYGLDPREGIAAITQRLRELAEDTSDEAERERIRAAWEELTLHPARRLRAAIHAHPETRAPLGAPPGPARPARLRVALVELELGDLAARPSALAALTSSATPPRPLPAGPAAPSLDEDPYF